MENGKFINALNGGGYVHALAILGILVLTTLAGVSAAAKSNQVDFGEIKQQLQRYARDLGDVGEAMIAHARTTMPKGLDKKQRASFAATHRELKATADAVLKLVIQIKSREKKAQRSTLKRVDMESLEVEADPLTRRINQRMRRAPARNSMSSTGLNEKIKQIESMQETVRNKRQLASTAFQNFDQKANQLYNMLSSVMKAMNEMRMSTVRNML